MDYSVSYSNNGAGRVSVNNGEFVVLYPTVQGKYHGHVRQWHELTEKIQNALRDAGYVTFRGKILRLDL